MTRCAGCQRQLKLTTESHLWRCGDGAVYGPCCFRLGAKHKYEWGKR